LLIGEEKLDEGATQRLSSLLALGDPGAEVAIAYRMADSTGGRNELCELL
jgi:transposase